jgi:hypothetical protein
MEGSSHDSQEGVLGELRSAIRKLRKQLSGHQSDERLKTIVEVDANFASPVAACDIIMKGGITSGVVYPLAIVELAKHYRFSSVGGTSAGAIAAAVTAAAEYARNVPGRGFLRLTRLPTEAGEILFRLFQPTRTVAPLFQIFVAAFRAKSTAGKIFRMSLAALWGFLWWASLFSLGGAIVALIAWMYASPGFMAFGLLLALVGAVMGIAVGLKRTVTTSLQENNFGVCSGIRQPGFHGPGFTDWLADLIDETAGRDPVKDDPLTFGDLASPGDNRPSIDLRMMTTNLMLGRPHTLPFYDAVYHFKREDFEKIFPARIMRYLLARSERFLPEAGEQGEYYKFPSAENLPVVVAARMSLSFPFLICAVPLYAHDRTLKGEESKPCVAACLAMEDCRAISPSTSSIACFRPDPLLRSHSINTM